MSEGVLATIAFYVAVIGICIGFIYICMEFWTEDEE